MDEEKFKTIQALINILFLARIFFFLIIDLGYQYFI